MSFLKLHADQLFDGYRFREKDQVLIATDKGVIDNIIPLSEAGEDVQHIEGILCPGFINAHCHLELSYLKDTIPTKTGLVSFISQVMQNRNADSEIIEEAIIKAEDEMLMNGIVAVGDICNTTYTIPQKTKGRIVYQNLIEVAGFAPYAAKNRFEAIQQTADAFYALFPNNTSIVPHAPYSVSIPLFQLIKNSNHKKLFSIHHQESDAENSFFQHKEGDFLTLYNNIGLDLSFFTKTNQKSTHYYIDEVDTSINSLFVHNTITSKEDLQIIIQKLDRSYFCICPSANLYIEDKLPDIELFRNTINEHHIVIGTDSLASNSSLDILKELMIIHEYYPNIGFEVLLKWATINGARALNLAETLGSFDKGKKPGIINLDTKNKYVKIFG